MAAAWLGHGAGTLGMSGRHSNNGDTDCSGTGNGGGTTDTLHHRTSDRPLHREAPQPRGQIGVDLGMVWYVTRKTAQLARLCRRLTQYDPTVSGSSHCPHQPTRTPRLTVSVSVSV